MKVWKKIMAFAVCMVMILAMTVTAFADDTTQTYTITAPDNDHVYEIYQIFTGKLSNGVLSDIKWGKNSKKKNVGENVPKDVLDALTSKNSSTDKEKLEEINNYVDLTTDPIATLSKNNTYEAEAGYYLIKDKEDSVAENDVYTTYIVSVVGDVKISPKGEVPEFTKKVKDTNDTTGEQSAWQDSADYDIGDEVPFQLNCRIPVNYVDYEHYYLAFHDVTEKGLSFDKESVKVYIDGKELKDTSAYEIKTQETGLDGVNGEKCTFEVIFNDLKKIDSVNSESIISVEYTAKLNDEAVIGQQGNVNSAKVEYSNNPNVIEEGKPATPGASPWDNVIVFTYKIVINKVDQDNKALGNAAFKLEKKNAAGAFEVVLDYTNEASENKTSFEFSGLDDGVYRLTETKTPEGYNSIDPITFSVTADHKIQWENENRTDVLQALSGAKESGQIELALNASNSDKGELQTTIINQAGALLPSTGGIGTRIFYIIGGILMVAAVVLITKVRFHNNK